MKRRLLLILPARPEVRGTEDFRQVKYALFPPLSLLTIAALTPEDRYEIIVRNEHVESSDVDGPVDLVGMTVYVSSARRAYELSRQWRRRGANVVLGGLHPTAMPAEAARHADAVCVGPAEPVWARILCDFERGCLRRLYRGAVDGSAALSPPARHDLVDPRRYLVTQTMVTSRGCPHACEFCYKRRFWGTRYHEGRPLATLERELEGLPGRLVLLLDDNLLGNRRHARNVFALLRRAGKVWQAAGSLDVARDPAFLDQAYAAGCRSLFVGFESLSPANMRAANKPVNAASDYAQAVRRFHEAGLMINGSFVFGFEGDDADVFDRTLDFAIETQIETATFHILTPFPGTMLHDRMARDGALLHRNWSLYDGRHAVFRPRRLTPGQLEAGHRRAYREFYRCGSILRRSIGLPQPLKRIAYNVGWKKVDWAWSALIRLGLLPMAHPVIERIIGRDARPAPASASAPRPAAPLPAKSADRGG